MDDIAVCDGPDCGDQLPGIDYQQAAPDSKGRRRSMEKSTAEDKTANQNQKLILEKKYIRLQEVGIACIVSMPVAVMLLFMLDLNVAVSLVMTIFILVTAGIICIALGEEGRNALRASDDNEPGSNCPKQ